MYEVIKTFKERYDNDFEYKTGDIYPREGFKPTKGRISDLLNGKKGKNNLTGLVYLKEAEEDIEEIADIEDIEEIEE